MEQRVNSAGKYRTVCFVIFTHDLLYFCGMCLKLLSSIFFMTFVYYIYLHEVSELYIWINTCILSKQLFIYHRLYMHESNWLSCFIFDQELDYVVEELEKIAVVHLLQNRSIISLIGNVQKSSLILEKVLYHVNYSQFTSSRHFQL